MKRIIFSISISCFSSFALFASVTDPLLDSYLRSGWAADKTVKLFQNCGEGSGFKSLANLQESLLGSVDKSKVRFICELNEDLKGINTEIKKDKQFMRNYISSKKNGKELKDSDHSHMTYLLVKYRMLRNPKTGSERFKDLSGKSHSILASATKFQWPNQTKTKMKKTAKAFIAKFGVPDYCYYLKIKPYKNKAGKSVQSTFPQKGKLTENSCSHAVEKRMSYNPRAIVIAQAIIESASGKSKWAKKYNNVLGLQVLFRNPETMGNYPNCVPAGRLVSTPKGKKRERCAIKFTNKKGGLYEYLYRFNGTHLLGYEHSREHRRKVCEIVSKKTNEPDCEKAQLKEKQTHCRRKGLKGVDLDLCIESVDCDASAGLAHYLNHYSEQGKKYALEVGKQIREVCSALPLCQY